MANLLIVTEKPSVAKSIASALGVKENEKHEGYIEGFSDYFGIKVWVTWCLGHLVQMSYPEAYDPKYAKWRLEDLPILPEEFRYEVIQETEKQFRIVAELMNSVGESEQDKREKSTLSQGNKFLVPVVSIAECTDSGREGELIYRLVYHMCGCKKPFHRLWISSMEDSAIRDGFANLRPSSEYDSLYEAALCRERADWIVGMNATRLFSCLYGQTLAVGRVMTPTLAMVVMRDAAIAAFKPEPFYTVQIKMDGVTAGSRKFKDKGEAETLLTKCRADGRANVQKIDRKEKTEKAPALYDLTSLQRDANRVLGFTAQQTLNYTQNLYEKKLVTYPRTDSRYLTDDMAGMVPGLVKAVAALYGVSCAVPVNTTQVIDSSKVSDHHAIIPTRSMPQSDLSGLSSGEQAVLRLIAARLISAVGEAHRYAETTAVFTCGGEEFTAKGKTIMHPGWKEIEAKVRPVRSRQKEEAEPKELPELRNGDVLDIRKSEVKEGKSTAPRHFTEDTLLQAMETASADEMPEEAERKGIGTPATRAGIIEKLVQKGFIERRGDKKTKYLCATTKGTALITVMPEQIQSPSMTADWEEKLLRIEKGEYSADSFMRGITDMIASLIGTYEIVKEADVLLPARTVVGICPHCGKEVVERKKGWFCENRDCRFALWKENAFFSAIGKKLTKDTAEKLLSSGKVHLTGCRSKKSGKSYDTTLILEAGEDGRASFRMEFGKGGKS